jgi:DNA-binding transcriptional ArsR family regulator
MNNSSDVHGILLTVPTEREISDTADVFGLLSDPGRLRLLAVLRHSESSVGQLAARTGLSESATSHALRLLRAHQVVAVRREGRMAFYSLADAHVSMLLETALEHAGHSELTHPERAGLRDE